MIAGVTLCFWDFFEKLRQKCLEGGYDLKRGRGRGAKTAPQLASFCHHITTVAPLPAAGGLHFFPWPKLRCCASKYSTGACGCRWEQLLQATPCAVAQSLILRGRGTGSEGPVPDQSLQGGILPSQVVGQHGAGQTSQLATAPAGWGLSKEASLLLCCCDNTWPPWRETCSSLCCHSACRHLLWHPSREVVST